MPSCAYSNHLHSPLAPRLWRLLAAWPLLVLLATLQTSTWAQDYYPPGAAMDPPGRVARLSLAQGAVSFAPADADGNAWTPAALNRPLTSGDRLWTGPRARAELHVGSTAVRMSEQTSLDFLALDDNVTQLRLAQGTVQLRVRALYEGQRLEINTPNLAFVISQAGSYRLDVNPARDTTRVVAQSGGGVIYGDQGMALDLGSQQQGSFSGTQLTPAAPGSAVQDSFDLWAAERDRREDQSVSARYIPRETIGYQQLDDYGDWRQDPAYGAIWLPRALPVNWAPYRAGHWSWISPWGWTWVDDAPWGFAPFHYGRWAQIGPRWAWVPGQLPQRPVYAPALVAFVGGSSGGVNWTISMGSGGRPQPGLGWFPLAPGEAYRPAYRASPRYVNRVNNNIAVNANTHYRYQRQPAAVTAVSRDNFVRGRLTQANTRPLNEADLGRARLIGDPSALPQRPEFGQRPRLAPAAALPPAAVAAQAVVRSRDEPGNDRRNAPGRVDERRNDPRAGRPDNVDRNPRVQAEPARAVPGPAQDRDAEPRARREQQQQMQRDQARQQAQQQQAQQLQQAQQQRAAQQEQQRQAQEQQLQRNQQEQQRALREQAQKQQELTRQQAQQQQAQQLQQAQQQRAAQQEQQRQAQEQQRRQDQEALGQQRALREQAQKQQELTRQQAQQQQAQQLQQAQQQRAAQQEQQRQAQEQQRQQQQDQRKAQAEERQKARPADAPIERGPRPDGQANRNREP